MMKSGNATVQRLSEKMLFLSFLTSIGSAEGLVRCGGKMKYFLIAYFLSNSCSKNYQNRFMCVKSYGEIK